MFKKLLASSFFILSIVGCGSLEVNSGEDKPIPTKEFSSIRVVDLDGKPVVGATISGKIEQLNGKQEVQYVSKFDELFLNIGPLSGSDIYSSDIAKLTKKSAKDTSGATDSNGKLTLENEIVPYGDTILKKKKVPYSTYYTVNVDRNYTRALVKVEKEGFYISENESVSPINNTVTLIKPEDYFKASIMEDQFKGVREQLKIVLSGLRVKSYLTDASLDYHSIGIYEFKGSKYIELNVKSTNVYNSIKLNKYDIGKKLYETTIVKLLDYLSLINDKTVAGVNVRIEGSTKNFMNENDTPTKIKYDFIMKTEDIKNYKNKDITSQRLLDNSVILMDNERVELKLQ